MDQLSSGFTHSVKKNIVKDNKSFYSVCVDDFFENPDTIREFGLSLEKQPDSTGAWPGLRTTSLHNIDPTFSNSFLMKVFSCYFDFLHHDISWSNSVVYFQQIPKFSNNKDDIKNVGWIHQDIEFDFAGLVYLTPNIDVDSGTSLFNLKNENEKFIKFQRHKTLLNLNQRMEDSEYEKEYSENLKKYYEKTRFNNVYNRLICYDAKEFHRANNFFSSSDDRLTLVFFVKGINYDSSPYNRILNKENFDGYLENRAKILKNENTKS
jgi:hypothetical protein